MNNLAGRTHNHFLQTHQPFDQRNMNKTQTSFQTQTTSPHLYMDVPRESYLKTLNLANNQYNEHNQSDLTMNKLQNNSSTKIQSSRNLFKLRHKSLNENLRKNEQQRINIENNKILRHMSNMRPTPTLDVDKLNKSYKKVASMKKKFV